MAATQLSPRPRSLNDCPLEEKDMNVVDDGKMERPKGLSRWISFTSKASVTVKEVRPEIGKRSRSTQCLTSMKEEESGLDNYREDSPDGKKEIGGKRPRRFSFLFVGTTPENDEEFSLDGDDTMSCPPKDDIATMVSKLFQTRKSRNGMKHKRNISTRNTTFKPRQQDLKLHKVKKDKKPLNIKSFWRPAKQDLSSNVDALSLTPTVVKKPKKTRQRSISVCDSKFSSISSALSFTTLPHELLTITSQQCTVLIHLLHKIARSLQCQERLTANFSTNLAHLFARKEWAINNNKRLGKEVRKMLFTMMTGLRELVGRTFLKKAVFLQRSLQLCHDLEDALLHEPGDRSTRLETSDLDTTLIPSLPEMNIAITISELPSTLSLLPKIQLDIHAFAHTLHTIREDISVQRQLDQALRGGTVGPCEDIRFPATIGERLAMKRFVAFVDGCLMNLERRYTQEGMVVGVLECLANMLKDGVGEGV